MLQDKNKKCPTPYLWDNHKFTKKNIYWHKNQNNRKRK